MRRGNRASAELTKGVARGGGEYSPILRMAKTNGLDADAAREFSVGQIVRPLDSVGCYVPGGRYPLVSTLLMTVIPAQVAGVKNIRVVSPKPQVRSAGGGWNAWRT